MSSSLRFRSFRNSSFFKWLIRIFAVIISLYILLAALIYFNKASILKKLSGVISEKVNGKVEIGKMDISLLNNFPNVSIVLNNIAVADSQFAIHKQYIIQMEKVALVLKWGAIFNADDKVKRISASNGSINLFIDSAGYSNQYLFKKGDKKEKKGTSAIPSIDLHNVVFSMRNDLKGKDHRLKVKDLSISSLRSGDVVRLDTELDIFVDRMIFNKLKGSYLLGKNVVGEFPMKLNTENGDFTFDDIRLMIDAVPFRITGKANFKDADKPFKLDISTDKIMYGKVRELVPTKLSNSLSIADVDQPIKAKAMVEGSLKGGLPLVKVSWEVKNAHIKTPLQEFDSASFSGIFYNEVVKGLPRKDPNSSIVISNFNAKWNGLPVESKNMQLMDLSAPTLNCDLTSQFELIQLNQLLGVQSFVFQKGQCNIQLSYSGPLQKNDSSNSKVNGKINFKDGQMLYVPRNVLVNNFNGNIRIENSDVYLDKMLMDIFSQKIVVDAYAKNLISMMTADPGNAIIDFKIASPSLNLERFTYFLKARKNVAKKSASINTFLSRLDEVLERGKLNVHVYAEKMQYKKFDAAQVAADISLLSDRYIVHDVKMKHAGGVMSVKGALLDIGKNYQASLAFHMKEMQVQKLFVAFENFGQDAITSQNLEGKLSVDATANLLINNDGKILPETIESNVDFLLQSGVLKKFDAVRKMQKFIFKNRNFDTIQFADLRNHLDIKNQKITFNRMEIRSSVLVMFVQGVYAKDGSTDIGVQVPLSNLVKNKIALNALNASNERRGGTSIFLRGRPGADGNVEFKLDLFKRYGK